MAQDLLEAPDLPTLRASKIVNGSKSANRDVRKSLLKQVLQFGPQELLSEYFSTTFDGHAQKLVFRSQKYVNRRFKNLRLSLTLRAVADRSARVCS